MADKMLIDATHPEETRVVVLRGNRVEEFDFESANRKQLRGNIYLAKVTRVEPSLQAAFVDYGGNRHGFLAFSEIHPDYYQIPVADRQALIDEEERAEREADAEADNYARRRSERAASRRPEHVTSEPLGDEEVGAMAAGTEEMVPHATDEHHEDESKDEPPTQSEAVTAVSPEQALAVTAASETTIDLAQLQSSSAADAVPANSMEPMPSTTETAVEGNDSVAQSPSDTGGSDNGANITEVNGHET